MTLNNRPAPQRFDNVPPKRSRALTLPLVGNFGAVARYFRDRDASLWGKVFVVSAFVYLIWPADLIPDVMPILGWLDDIGFVAVALTFLSQVVKDYQEP